MKEGKRKNMRSEGSANLDYQVPSHSIRGPEVVEIIAKNFKEALSKGLKKISDLQRESGVTIIPNQNMIIDIIELVRALTKSGRPYPLIYMNPEKLKHPERVNFALPHEVLMWMENRDDRDLITDLTLARGWEDDTILVFDEGLVAIENVCLRAVSNLVVVYFGGHKYEDHSMVFYNEMCRVAEVESDLRLVEEYEFENVDEERKNEIRKYLSEKIRDMEAELQSENVDEEKRSDNRRYLDDMKNANMLVRIEIEEPTPSDKNNFQDGDLDHGIDRLKMEDDLKNNEKKKPAEFKNLWFPKGFLLPKKKKN